MSQAGLIWRRHRIFGLLLAVCLCLGLVQALRAATTDRSNIFLFACLTALLSWNISAYLPSSPILRSLSARLSSWAAISVAAIFALSSYYWHSSLVLQFAGVLLAMALSFRLVGLLPAFISLPSFILSLFLLPNQEHLLLSLSYPLRLLSTIISVSLLKLGNLTISHYLTSIRLGASEIAITDACSGINQLTVMMLLGYLLVRSIERALVWRIIHYCFLFPAIIVANSLRLMASLLLYLRIGERAFLEPFHSWLGYVMVIVSVVLLWGVGFLLPQTTAAQTTAVTDSDGQATDHKQET